MYCKKPRQKQKTVNTKVKYSSGDTEGTKNIWGALVHFATFNINLTSLEQPWIAADCRTAEYVKVIDTSTSCTLVQKKLNGILSQVGKN